MAADFLPAPLISGESVRFGWFHVFQKFHTATFLAAPAGKASGYQKAM
jgi:hypothetical protein